MTLPKFLQPKREDIVAQKVSDLFTQLLKPEIKLFKEQTLTEEESVDVVKTVLYKLKEKIIAQKEENLRLEEHNRNEAERLTHLLETL